MPAVRWDELAGRRVALRHRLPAAARRPGGPVHTDAVGELARDGDWLLVHTRRGVARIDPAAVTAVREVPPPAARRPSWAAVARLEGLCADAWPPLVTRPLGQWRLRAAAGFTGRANSALAAGDPGMAVPEALDRVCEFAREHRIPPRVQVPAGSPWHREVSAAGWEFDDAHAAGAEVSVLVGEVSGLSGGAARGVPGVRVEVDPVPAQDWWSLAVDGSPTEAGRRVLAGPGPDGAGLVPGFVAARDRSGTVLGVARLAVLAGHLHVSRVAVDPGHRRRGLARALMAASAGWAGERGASWCVLQVAVGNDAALGLYRDLGLRPHHRYHYLRPAGEPG